jgi:ABC-2 type transport system ATP-binding protein
MNAQSQWDNILEVHNLRKTYGTLEALKGVSFSISPGDVFGYLGPNGSGKTTTLRIITGLVHQNSGEVAMFGKQVRQDSVLSTLPVSIGYLPGELRLYGNMTAQLVLDYFARYRPQRPPILREQLISALQVDAVSLKKKIKYLSHGTRQKIGLIIAMQHDPDLLLLDEPTLGLDPLVQKSFGEVILDLAKRGKAILFSSHILSEVETLCNRVAILRDGKIVTEESIEALRANVVRRLQIRFRNGLPFDISRVPGVTRSEIEGNLATVWVRGDINPIIRTLARLELEHVVFPEAELEDIFFSYYSTEEEENA